jgi:Fur family ferric uptake transcriptional regulator
LLQKAHQPLSAQNVVDQVGATMDQATVYRIFKDLKAKGIIRPIDLRHNHAHYELARADDHHHLICVRCGKIEDVRDCGVEEMQETIARRSKQFATVKTHSLEFYGVCNGCAKKASTSH